MSLENEKHLDNRTYIALFAVLFGLVFARYCYYGFEYFYQLDDYIQYHNIKAANLKTSELFRGMGLLSSRPLAGLCDLFVWSNFYSFMIVAVGIISAMYAGSAILLHKVFSKHFGTGFLFFVIYALLPLGFEGTYWVSASSRIVVGLFFAALSLYFFDDWCEKGKTHALVLFAAFQLIAFCFYEQIVLFSGAATFIIMLLNFKSRNRRALWGLLMFVGAGIYFAVTLLAPTDITVERMALFFPWQEGYSEFCALPAGRQMVQAFFNGGYATFVKGLVRGFEIIFSEPNFLFILAILILCTAFLLIARKTKREDMHFLPALLAGAFLTMAPLLLFFVLKDPWFGLRNTVTSFCGIALMLDALLGLITKRLANRTKIEAWIAGVIALLFCIASVSEIHDYRETTLADTAIASAAAQAFENEDFHGKGKIWILNVDASYVKNGNFYYHDHNYGAAGTDWSLTGAVRAISNRGDIPMLTPVSVYRTLPVADDDISDDAKMFFYTGEKLVPVTPKQTGSNWSLCDAEGKTLGTMRVENGGAILEVK
ncbi:MAG: hypothetical protein RSA62_02250 [Oscillospiraceae bacterium]